MCPVYGIVPLCSCLIVVNGISESEAIASVVSQKKQIVAQSGALSFCELTEAPENVGGLGALKKWLAQRRNAFSQEATDFNLPPPRGILLIGVPGTGKSLAPKMAANIWKMSLVRLDIGALYHKWVGESDAHLRQALRIVERVSPCILWIDEIEKGMVHGETDSGVSKRIFGGILTWMSEKTAPCCVMGTANDISSLPMELTRKGGFDETFFLDLPTFTERKAIFAAQISLGNTAAIHWILISIGWPIARKATSDPKLNRRSLLGSGPPLAKTDVLW